MQKPRTDEQQITRKIREREMEDGEDLRLSLSLRTVEVHRHHPFASVDQMSLTNHEMRERSISGGGGGGSDEDELGGSGGEMGMGRKKLRLSKLQSSILEDAFKRHHTLNPREKMALSQELNLRPRQVEVWFQNRRARKKLKKTEVDCEMLKRCCENLSEENRRLHRELLELRALKRTPPSHLCMQQQFGSPPSTTLLSICPSCERAAANGAHAATTGTNTQQQQLQLHRRQISPLS